MKNEDLLTSAQLKKIRKFTVSYYSMYIYGTCSKCTHAKRMKLRRLARTNISGRAKKKQYGRRDPKKQYGRTDPKAVRAGGPKKSSPVKLAKKKQWQKQRS